MSRSKHVLKRKFPFLFQVIDECSGRISLDSKITVYDGWDEIKCDDYGQVESSLPAGLYTVRVERGGEMKEESIRHTGPTDVSIHEPKRYSALPSFDTVTTHEYYEVPSRQWSMQDTSTAIGKVGSKPERLFIFIRAISKERYKQQDLGNGLSLWNLARRELLDFNQSVTKRDEEYGWLAFSAPAERGGYILKYSGDPPREMPVYVYKDWDTQIFVTYHGRPLLESASILMPHKGVGFCPDDRIAQAVDAALSGLQNRLNLMPMSGMKKLIYEKFDNPMLGILGAHLLLQQKDVNPNTISFVLGNLNNLLTDSPDVQALRVINAKRFNKRIPTKPFERPPMLRIGLEAVIDASIDVENLVPENSLIDWISSYTYADSPWTSWKPIERSASMPVIEKFMATARRYMRPEAVSQLNTMINSGFSGIRITTEPLLPEVSKVDDWVISYLRDALKESKRTKENLDLRKISSEIGIPFRTVKRVYNDALSGDISNDHIPNQKDSLSNMFPVFLETITAHQSLSNKETRIAQKLVKNQRKRIKITQAAMARLLGVSQTTVSSWERGQTSPATNKLKAIKGLSKMEPDSLRNLIDLAH